MTTPVPGKPAPTLEVDLVGGGGFDLAAATPEAFTMVVFYRGKHCPVCERYLGRLRDLLGEYRDLGVETIAVSMDHQSRAERTVDQWELGELRVGYGLTEDTARSWGLFLSTAVKEGEPDLFPEPGLFLVRADGTLFYAAINSLPWGRPDLDRLPKAIRYVQDNDYPVRGIA